MLATSGLVASCSTPGTLPTAGMAPDGQVLASEQQAAAHRVSRCLFDEAVARDTHEASVRAMARRVIVPCKPQFEAMLQLEKEGLNQSDALGFDQAMRRQELNIAALEVAAARRHSLRQRSARNEAHGRRLKASAHVVHRHRAAKAADPPQAAPPQ